MGFCVSCVAVMKLVLLGSLRIEKRADSHRILKS